MLANHEVCLSELQNNDEAVNKMLAEGKALMQSPENALFREMIETKDVVLAEAWSDVKELLELRSEMLRRASALQRFFAEAASLEVVVRQQEDFVVREEIPVSVHSKTL